MSGADQVSAIITDVTLATVYWLLATPGTEITHTTQRGHWYKPTEKPRNGLTSKKMLPVLLTVNEPPSHCPGCGSTDKNKPSTGGGIGAHYNSVSSYLAPARARPCHYQHLICALLIKHAAQPTDIRLGRLTVNNIPQ